MKQAATIRPIPFDIPKLAADNVIRIGRRERLWVHLDPEALRTFPFFRLADGAWLPASLVCVDDEAPAEDRELARVLADAFASGATVPPHPPLTVATRAQADGMQGPPPAGGPNRIGIGPRDSLLFPSFGFNADEKRHVGAGGSLITLADDPDGYRAIHVVGVDSSQRRRAVYRLIAALRQARVIP